MVLKLVIGFIFIVNEGQSAISFLPCSLNVETPQQQPGCFLAYTQPEKWLKCFHKRGTVPGIFPILRSLSKNASSKACVAEVAYHHRCHHHHHIHASHSLAAKRHPFRRLQKANAAMAIPIQDQIKLLHSF